MKSIFDQITSVKDKMDAASKAHHEARQVELRDMLAKSIDGFIENIGKLLDGLTDEEMIELGKHDVIVCRKPTVISVTLDTYARSRLANLSVNRLNTSNAINGYIREILSFADCTELECKNYPDTIQYLSKSDFTVRSDEDTGEVLYYYEYHDRLKCVDIIKIIKA